MPLVRIRFGTLNEDRARIHNGGPNGYKKKATVGYWSDVKGKMK